MAQESAPHAQTGEFFQTSAHCIACHSNLKGPDGRDISIGTTWRATMMANSSRDPYWHAAIRREVTDHPPAQAAIENICSTCHMPMAHFTTVAAGGQAKVFANLEAMRIDQSENLAADGVSCTVCHQIEPDNFGTRESFEGGFLIDKVTPPEQRAIYGPHEVDAGRQHLMQSASSFVPTAASHMAESELCGTCHTLYTEALDAEGRVIGELPEQMPYVEWAASDFRETKSCQDCHMPVITRDTPISSVHGQPRPAVSQHIFRGGNSFIQTMLNKYRGELGVKALPQELDASIARTNEFLGTETAEITIESARRSGQSLAFDIAVRSLSGHKLPTAYPSRRVWLHVTVTDSSGNVLFESGAVRADGSIAGNANDADPQAYEPHYNEITQADQVQIYEPILGDSNGDVTTGLLRGVRYIKDNRLLPEGFDKRSVTEDIAVRGGALEDEDFVAGGDRIRYRLDVGARGAVTVDAELLYQAIGHRWAENLKDYSTPETDRFVGFYGDTIEGAEIRLAADSVTTN